MPKKTIIILILLTPLPAAAIDYQITTPIPGFNQGVIANDLGSYVANIFTYGLSIVGLVAFAMLGYNGVKYIMGASDESKVGEAKSGITQVIIGVILLFASVVILNTINPCIVQTVNFWSDRTSIQTQCGTGTGLVVPLSPNVTVPQRNAQQQEIDAATQNLISGTGPQVNHNSNNIEVIGYSNRDNKILKVIINPDGSYEVQQFNSDDINSNGSYTPTGERGDNFYDYQPDFASPQNSTWQQSVDTQVRNMVLVNSSQELTYRPVGDNIRYFINPSSNNSSFDISLDDNFLGRNVTASGTCNRINPPNSSVPPYYRCAGLNVEVDGSSRQSDRVVYLEELPDEGTRNASYETLRGFLTREIRNEN